MSLKHSKSRVSNIIIEWKGDLKEIRERIREGPPNI